MPKKRWRNRGQKSQNQRARHEGTTNADATASDTERSRPVVQTDLDEIPRIDRPSPASSEGFQYTGWGDWNPTQNRKHANTAWADMLSDDEEPVPSAVTSFYGDAHSADSDPAAASSGHVNTTPTHSGHVNTTPTSVGIATVDSSGDTSDLAAPPVASQEEMELKKLILQSQQGLSLLASRLDRVRGTAVAEVTCMQTQTDAQVEDASVQAASQTTETEQQTILVSRGNRFSQTPVIKFASIEVQTDDIPSPEYESLEAKLKKLTATHEKLQLLHVDVCMRTTSMREERNSLLKQLQESAEREDELTETVRNLEKKVQRQDTELLKIPILENELAKAQAKSNADEADVLLEQLAESAERERELQTQLDIMERKERDRLLELDDDLDKKDVSAAAWQKRAEQSEKALQDALEENQYLLLQIAEARSEKRIETEKTISLRARIEAAEKAVDCLKFDTREAKKQCTELERQKNLSEQKAMYMEWQAKTMRNQQKKEEKEKQAAVSSQPTTRHPSRGLSQTTAVSQTTASASGRCQEHRSDSESETGSQQSRSIARNKTSTWRPTLSRASSRGPTN